MLEAAYAQNPNIKIMLSGYSNFKDKTFSYARSLPGNLILQMKWDDDWAVSNDPRIPKEWLGVKDHILRPLVIVYRMRKLFLFGFLLLNYIKRVYKNI